MKKTLNNEEAYYKSLENDMSIEKELEKILHVECISINRGHSFENEYRSRLDNLGCDIAALSEDKTYKFIDTKFQSGKYLELYKLLNLNYKADYVVICLKDEGKGFIFIKNKLAEFVKPFANLGKISKKSGDLLLYLCDLPPQYSHLRDIPHLTEFKFDY